eukprot:Amastigsp_a843960_162.p3 type:complete len:195 gc:universal Amastigsp_a843960_162:560-1144(+)
MARGPPVAARPVCGRVARVGGRRGSAHLCPRQDDVLGARAPCRQNHPQLRNTPRVLRQDGRGLAARRAAAAAVRGDVLPRDDLGGPRHPAAGHVGQSHRLLLGLCADGAHVRPALVRFLRHCRQQSRRCAFLRQARRGHARSAHRRRDRNRSADERVRAQPHQRPGAACARSRARQPNVLSARACTRPQADRLR